MTFPCLISCFRDILNIQNNLAHLVDYNQDKDEFAKRFDLLVYKLQLSLINGNKSQVAHIGNMYNIVNMLFTKRNIPAVQAKIETIKKLQKGTILMAVFDGLTAAAEPYIFILKRQKNIIHFYVRFWYLVVIGLFIFWSKIFLVEQIIMMLDARFIKKISICWS